MRHYFNFTRKYARKISIAIETSVFFIALSILHLYFKFSVLVLESLFNKNSFRIQLILIATQTLSILWCQLPTNRTKRYNAWRLIRIKSFGLGNDCVLLIELLFRWVFASVVSYIYMLAMLWVICVLTPFISSCITSSSYVLAYSFLFDMFILIYG